MKRLLALAALLVATPAEAAMWTEVSHHVTFEPTSEDTELLIGENGETMTLTAKGFSSMSGYDVTTAANAQATLNKLLGDADNVGEADCVFYERLGAVRAEAARACMPHLHSLRAATCRLASASKVAALMRATRLEPSASKYSTRTNVGA